MINARVSTKNQNHNNKDRFIRFGYDRLDKLCKKFNTTRVVVNNKKLMQDIASILDVFSCRLQRAS